MSMDPNESPWYSLPSLCQPGSRKSCRCDHCDQDLVNNTSSNNSSELWMTPKYSLNTPLKRSKKIMSVEKLAVRCLRRGSQMIVLLRLRLFVLWILRTMIHRKELEEVDERIESCAANNYKCPIMIGVCVFLLVMFVICCQSTSFARQRTNTENSNIDVIDVKETT